MRLKRNRQGQSARQAAAAQAADGFEVWRSWDEAGGIRDELYEIAADNPQLVKLEVLGETHEGRELIALKVTQGARGHRRRSPSRGALQLAPARPRVDLGRGQPTVPASRDRRLAGQRPRDQGPPADDRALVRHRGQPGWLSVHVRQRTPVAEEPARQRRRRAGHPQRRGRPQPQLRRALPLRRRGLVVVAGERHLPRPEPGLRAGDPGRAGPGRPDRPSSSPTGIRSAAGSCTRRVGRSGRPTPTTRSTPRWRAPTPTPPSRVRPGHQRRRAVRDQRGDHRLRRRQRRDHRVHPELGEGTRVGFVFPDDEALVQAEFANTVDFSMGLARSAHDPDDPASPVGDETEPFYLDQAEVDDENSPLSMFDFTFDVSYGDPQEVRVLAKRDLGPVTVKFRINGGDVQTAHDRMDRRRALRRRQRHLLPRHERAGHRHQSGQHGGGVVRSGRRAQRLVHVHGRVGDRQPAPPPRRRGLHRRLTRLRRPDPAVVPVLLHRRTRRQRRGARRVRRRRQRPDGPRTRWAC